MTPSMPMAFVFVRPWESFLSQFATFSEGGEGEDGHYDGLLAAGFICNNGRGFLQKATRLLFARIFPMDWGTMGSAIALVG